MLPKTPKLLEDVRDAATFIADVTCDITEADYRHNRMLRQSVERNFEIVGEAMRRLAQHDPATAQGITFFDSVRVIVLAVAAIILPATPPPAAPAARRRLSGS